MSYLTEAECLSIASKRLDLHLVSKGKTKSGVSSYVFEMEGDSGQKYYFKQGNNNYLIQKKLEKILNDQDLPTPPILLATDKYMIVRGIMGEAMGDVTDRKTKLGIVEQFGEYLAKLHKNMTYGWGELIDTDKGKYTSYLDFYTKLLPEVPSDIRDTIKGVLSETTQGCLNHADTGSSHIFTNREEGFWGLIDFDDILSAPNLYDLAEFHGGIGDDFELWDRLMIGYCKVGKPVDTESLEFLVNEYLIYLDSLIWYKSQNRPELNADMQRDSEMVKILADKIRKIC